MVILITQTWHPQTALVAFLVTNAVFRCVSQFDIFVLLHYNIFLDYPLEICIDGVKKRKGKPRGDMPWIETEDDPEFIEYIKSFGKDQNPKISALLEKYSDKNIVVFKSREEADRFIKQYI